MTSVAERADWNEEEKMGCRNCKPHPVSREWGRKGHQPGGGVGVGVEEGARVVLEKGDWTCRPEAGGGGEESRVLMWRQDDQCPLSSIL